MAQIVNDNKLTLVLTDYGLARVAQALNDPAVEIYLSKIKLGDANGEYYNPAETLPGVENPSLVNPIPGAEFYLIDKDLLEDGLTVSLHAIIPEISGGYDVREVGLYETISGVDYLFAVSTQQPLVKPGVDYNYLITVDYYMFLRSQNFANVYDQIIINPETGLVTYTDLDQYLKTVLFSQASLMDQIGHNSEIIGLDRAEQLYRKILSDRDNFGYYSTYNSFSTLLDFVKSENVFGFWVFDYPRRTPAVRQIIDISPNKRNMVCDQPINVYKRKYFGIAPTLGILGNHFYSVPSNVNVSLLNYDETADADFTMIFCVTPSGTGNRTLLAKSDDSLGINVFEVKELSDNSLEITLFTDSSNYKKFTSASNSLPAEAYALVITYVDSVMKAFVNGEEVILTTSTTGTYTHMNPSQADIYAWKATPIAYAANVEVPVALLNADGTPIDDNDWSISGNAVYYDDHVATQSGSTVATDTLYAWTYDGHTIYTKVTDVTEYTSLYNSDYTLYTGTLFSVVTAGGTSVIQYDGSDTSRDSGNDIASVTLYPFIYNPTGAEALNIWTNSVSNPGVLLNSDGTRYSGEDWSISAETIFYRGKYQAVRSSNDDITLSNISVTSYVTDSSGNIGDPINSYVGIISIIKEGLELEEARKMSLVFSSEMGVNPCVGEY